MSFKPDDRVVITSVPARAAMNGVRAGMKATILPMPADYDDSSLPLVKLRIGTWEFYWSPNDIEPDTARPHPVQLMVGAPLGPDMNSLLAVIRRIISADDWEFDSHALRQDVAELRKLMRGMPE